MKRNRRILIVDDDADDRKYFIDAVNEIDDSVECLVARDGQHALEVLKQYENELPDIIFLDQRMPRFSGKQCLQHIKSDVKLRKIPIYIYTTSKEVNEAQELLELGAASFITKPADPEEIFYVLSIILEEEWDEIL